MVAEQREPVVEGMRAAMVAEDARHSDNYGGDENYETEDDHGSPR